MNTRRHLLSLAVAATLAPLPAGAATVPILDDFEFTFDVRAEKDLARVEMQLAQADEGRKRGERVREEIRIDMPDIGAAVSDAISSVFNYSFSGPSRTVRNAPYSGEVINEKVQTLADGNQIVRRSTNRVYRDGQGSTRQEMLDDSGQVKTVHIRDAEGNRLMLHPAKRTALRIGAPDKLIEKHAREVARTVDKKVIVTTDDNVIVKRIDSEGKEHREEVRVIAGSDFKGLEGLKGLERLKDLKELKDLKDLKDLKHLDVLGDLPHLEHAFANAWSATGDAFSHAWRMGEPLWVGKDKKYERTTTQLGSKSFDGVVAEGKATSYTIPAGRVGNQKPISVTTETWYSPELQITVYSKHSDPRAGDTIYRVANLRRAEPAPDLFKVPAGYDVKDPLARAKALIEKIDRAPKG